MRHYEIAQKRKRPRLIESWDARRTALPRSLLTNRVTIRAAQGNGTNGLLEKAWWARHSARFQVEHVSRYGGNVVPQVI
jgi:hypothetical protein